MLGQFEQDKAERSRKMEEGLHTEQGKCAGSRWMEQNHRARLRSARVLKKKVLESKAMSYIWLHLVSCGYQLAILGRTFHILLRKLKKRKYH